MTLHQEGFRAWVKPPTPGAAGLTCGSEELGETHAEGVGVREGEQQGDLRGPLPHVAVRS